MCNINYKKFRKINFLGKKDYFNTDFGDAPFKSLHFSCHFFI